MPQRLRDYRIHLKNERARLAPRREPYWRHIDVGRHVGYRKMDSGSETWIARWTDDEARYHYKSLGSLAARTWSDAKKAAEAWFGQCEAGVVRAGTVEQLCRDYVDNRRVEVSERNAADAAKRFTAYVYGTGFGRKRLDKLGSRDVERWRNELLARSTPLNTERTGSIVKAALNYGFAHGDVGSDAAWRKVSMRMGEGERNELDFYWPVEQRRMFLAECPDDLRDFLQAIAHTGARPQEIASALVEDFDPFARKLVLRHRKGHKSRLRTRDFHLSNDAAFAFFKRVAKGKTPKAPLLTRTDGSGWYSDKGHGAWVAMVKRIRRAHKFDDRLTAYHFRHWTITDMLNAGIVAANVATMAGTSIEMIDAYYKKYVASAVDERLRGLETV
ncbi:MAG: site-specific integrase [Pseudomonadales bacterium]